MAKYRERSTPRQRHQRHAREDLTEARDCARCRYMSVKSSGARDCHCSSPASPNHAVVVHTFVCNLLLRTLSSTSATSSSALSPLCRNSSYELKGEMQSAFRSLSTLLIVLCVFCAGTDAFMSTPVTRFPRTAYVRRTGALCLSMQNQV